MKIAAVTCVKNEGPFILEWIAFNQIIGVTGFLFYSNDCDDGTDVMLDALAGHGIVTHLPNPARNGKYQMEALRDAGRQKIITGADWIWNADIDEFLNIHAGSGTIQDLIEACGRPDLISVSHQNFANGGVGEYVDEPVIGQFFHSHNPDIWMDRLDIEVKTLMRGGLPVARFGAHRPFLKDDLRKSRMPRWTDGSGRPVSRRFVLNLGEKRRLGFSARGARQHATLNHYALRSLDSYLVKSDRGDVNRANRELTDTYWCERNDGAFRDDTITRYLKPLAARIDQLKKLPGIADLHEAAVAAHRAKIAALRQRGDFAELRARLAAAPTIPPAELAVIAALENGLAPL